MNGHPRVSVIIITHNRAHELSRTVAATLDLPEKPPIIVVDNDSSDGTEQKIRQRFPRVELIPLDRNLGAAARNIGARCATTPYIAFCDDDVRWAPGSLMLAGALLDQHPRVAALSARVLIGDEKREDPTCTLMAASPLPSTNLPGPVLLGFLAGAAVFRRDAFLAVGGFHPKFFIGGEESLLAIDLIIAGWSILYADCLTVHHHPSVLRDRKTRRRLEIRNALWTTWLRRPLPGLLQCTVDILKKADIHDAINGGIDALEELPWIFKNRKIVPPRVEALCRLVENRDGRPSRWRAERARLRRFVEHLKI